ncbi:MAG: Gfo/Idh/MocA family oxidoreductase [bacterium]
MGKIRAAVVGAGYLGRFHALKYAKLPQVELVAVVDLLYERAKAVAKETGAQPMTDFRDLQARVDAVTVAVPTTDHHMIATWLMNKGIHVLVEKPMAATLEQAQEMVDLCIEKGVVLQVGHLERFNPIFREIRTRVRKPLFFNCERISPYPGRGTDVDVVLDLMIHDIDLVLDLLGETPVEVEAIGVPVLTSTYDMVSARLRFPKGQVANLTASRVSAKSLRKIRIFQPDTYISVDFARTEAQIFRKLPPQAPGTLPRIAGEKLQMEPGDALLEEVSSFVDVITRGGKPEVDGLTALRCLEVALAVCSSIEANVPQDLGLVS